VISAFFIKVSRHGVAGSDSDVILAKSASQVKAPQPETRDFELLGGTAECYLVLALMNVNG
jgi:hypothetical protein